MEPKSRYLIGIVKSLNWIKHNNKRNKPAFEKVKPGLIRLWSMTKKGGSFVKSPRQRNLQYLKRGGGVFLKSHIFACSFVSSHLNIFALIK